MSFLDSIGNAVSGLADDAIGSVLSDAEKALGSLVGGLGANGLGSGLFSFLSGNGLDSILKDFGGGGLGSLLETVAGGDVGSLLSGLTDLPGTLAKKLCDSILPPDLQFVGDIVAGTMDYVDGNEAGAAQCAVGLLKDLQPALKGLLGSLNAAEPDAPPKTGGSAGASTSDTSTSGVSTSGPTTTAGSSAATSDTSTQAGSGSAAPEANTSSGTSAAIASGSFATSGADASLNGGGAIGTNVLASRIDLSQTGTAPDISGDISASSATPAGLVRGTDTDTATYADAVTSSDDTSSSSGTAPDPVKTDDPKAWLDQFQNDPAGLADAIRNGSVPDSVLKDPASEQRLQLMLQDFTTMSQTMSNLLSTLHQMEMAVVQNLRA